ncbi:hypothetical protein [Acanthamoeba polyphaga mimivirus]|uniref:Uncharacterized protein n=1 Tax=Acanthamoeba polyphaga mimivirus TaxID=212035 RepID=A0A0G2Y1Q5_MIMIV|nr:hypothetical protein [Acanthamoeba polyphaga mimivirus]
MSNRFDSKPKCRCVAKIDDNYENNCQSKYISKCEIPRNICQRKNIDFFYDFRLKYSDADFDYVFGTDGVVTQNFTGLTVNSVPFTQTVPIGNEHPKWLKFYKDAFPLYNDREVIFETEMSGVQVIDGNSIPEKMKPRIRNVDDDLRLASGALNVIDPNTWMVFDFFVTNTAIYAFYERLPFGKTSSTPSNTTSQFGNKSFHDKFTHNGSIHNGSIHNGSIHTRSHCNPNPDVPTDLGNYAAFSNAIWVARRSADDPLSQFSKLAIGIHKGKGLVTWYIDDVPVFTWDRIGYRMHDEYRMVDHGGIEGIVSPDSMRLGFGTFSLFDMNLPNDYDRGYVDPVVVLPDGPHREIARSALIQLDFAANYRETFPDPYTGLERPLADPAITFAYTLGETPDDNRAIKLFGQGAIIKLKYLRVYTRSPNAKPEFSRVNH